MNSISLGVVRVLVNLPNWLALAAKEPLLNAIVATSKRTLLKTLNTSQLNLMLCDSLIFHALVRDISVLRNPGPRRLLRCPDSPGKAARNALDASGPC